MVLSDWWLVTSNVEGESKGLAVAGYIAKYYSLFTKINVFVRVQNFHKLGIQTSISAFVPASKQRDQTKERKNCAFTFQLHFDLRTTS